VEVRDDELNDMIATVTLREDLPERRPLGHALIELRQLRAWWRALKRVDPGLASEIEEPPRRSRVSR
jgi:hypothetical protein